MRITRKQTVIYSLFLLLVLWACKKEEEIIYGQGTTLKIEIKDEAGVVIEDEIEVHLYDNENTYTSDLLAQNPENSIYQTTSTGGGIATFENIEPTKIYYIYINYNGKPYTLNNFNFYHTLENPLLADAITSLSIELRPFNVGQLAFWTDQTNLNHLGIEIFIEDSLIGSLNGVKTSEPTSVDDSQIVPIIYQTAGTYNWQAKGDNGCYWSGTINLSEDDLLPVELSSCDFGSVMFWSSPSLLSTNGELTVYINEEAQESGEIKEGRSSSPTICDFSASDYLTIERPVGNYTYKITAENTSTVWVGTFAVTNGCGEAIEITQD
jgi:hypothetical protein